MLSKKLALAMVAGTALLAASGAYAQDRHARHGYGWHAGHHHRHAPYRVVVVRPAPYGYYEPAPVYYPPPRYYAPPRPVIYGQIPISPDVRVRFGVQF